MHRALKRKGTKFSQNLLYNLDYSALSKLHIMCNIKQKDQPSGDEDMLA